MAPLAPIPRECNVMDRWVHVGFLTVVAILACIPSLASANPVSQEDVQKAQVAMLGRVSDAAYAYAKKIGIDESYVSYCYTEMGMHTDAQPDNGKIPFGVNYNNIRDAENLATIINVREAYERSYLTLCLANAKAALNRAATK